jgi:hypothetical protein
MLSDIEDKPIRVFFILKSSILNPSIAIVIPLFIDNKYLLNIDPYPLL